MSDLAIAIAFAVALSLLIGVIELSYRSNAGLGACRSSAAVLYILILVIGNTATTLLAAATTGGGFVSTTAAAGAPSQSAPLVLPFRWFWYAFLGVFGFEALLQNMNLTFFGKGVLSISDWIGKARDNAVASAVVAQTRETYSRAHQLADKLKALPVKELNAHVLNALGAARLKELEEDAAANKADATLIKALALAYEAPDKAAAIKVS